jgi:hypothetical protein
MHTLTLHLQALAADTLTMAKYGFRLWRADIRELRLFHRDLRRAAALLAVSPSPTSSEHGEAIFLVTETAFGMASGGPLAAGALPPAGRATVPAGFYAVPRGMGHRLGGRPAGRMA